MLAAPEEDVGRSEIILEGDNIVVTPAFTQSYGDGKIR